MFVWCPLKQGCGSLSQSHQCSLFNQQLRIGVSATYVSQGPDTLTVSGEHKSYQFGSAAWADLALLCIRTSPGPSLLTAVSFYRSL